MTALKKKTSKAITEKAKTAKVKAAKPVKTASKAAAPKKAKKAPAKASKAATKKATKTKEKDSKKKTFRRGVAPVEFINFPNKDYQSLFKCIHGFPGLPKGKMIELFGPEGCGKSSTGLLWGAQMQLAVHEYAHADAEHALAAGYAEKLLGVDITKLVVPEQPFANGEEVIQFLQDVYGENIQYAVWDSITATIPQAIIDGEAKNVGAHAKFMSQNIVRLIRSLSQSEGILVAINQLRSKIGVMFGDPDDTTGGKGPKYYASVRDKLVKKKIIKEEGTGRELGYLVGYQPVKNRLGFKRGTFNVVVDAGFNFNFEKTAVQWAKDFSKLGLIDKEARTFAGFPVSGNMAHEKPLVEAIRGNAHVVFDAIDEYFTEMESGKARVFDGEEDGNEETYDETAPGVEIAESLEDSVLD